MKKRAMSIGGNIPEAPKLVGVMMLLDRSGSMNEIKAAMEKQFGEFVAAQRKDNPDGLWLTLHQFDSGGYDEVYVRRPIAQVKGLTLAPRWNTPLCDSLVEFAQKARAVIDDEADPTDRLLLVIVTDGRENASKFHTWSQARAAIDGLEANDVEIIWLGTDAAIEEAKIQAPTFAGDGATLGFSADEQGVAYAYGGLLRATTAYRRGTSARVATASYKSEVGRPGPGRPKR